MVIVAMTFGVSYAFLSLVSARVAKQESCNYPCKPCRHLQIKTLRRNPSLYPKREACPAPSAKMIFALSESQYSTDAVLELVKCRELSRL